jgi:hypothetical protein
MSGFLLSASAAAATPAPAGALGPSSDQAGRPWLRGIRGDGRGGRTGSQVESSTTQLLSNASFPSWSTTSLTASLLHLPTDVLRSHVFNQERSGLDRCFQLVCRQVCRRLRDVIAPQVPGERLDLLAASAGYVHFLERLMPKNRPPRTELCTAAAAAGHMLTLQWLRARGARWNPAVPYHAAKNGDFEMLKWRGKTAVDCIPRGVCCSRRAG